MSLKIINTQGLSRKENLPCIAFYSSPQTVTLQGTDGALLPGVEISEVNTLWGIVEAAAEKAYDRDSETARQGRTLNFFY